MGDVIGIDLGTYAIKLAQVKHGMGSVELAAIGSAYNPVGQFVPSDEAQFQKLAATIKQLLSEQHLSGKSVQVALPESLAYTSVISMPYLSDAELSSSIHWEAEQHIPVPLDEVNLEYEVLYKPKKGEEGEKMRVLLVAAKKDLINRLVDLFHTAGVEVVGLETVLLSTHRALQKTLSSQQAIMVCHIGALSTDILIVEKGEMVLSYTVQTGGLALTRSVERNLQLPPQQAEEYKRAYGLDATQLEGRVRQVLAPVGNIIVAEVRKAMQYYQTSNMLTPVQSMIISGGSAYLPALPSFMAESFSFEVVIANPLESVTVKQGLQLPDNMAAFTPAIGLGLRSE